MILDHATAVATTRAPGRILELARICLVCLWRELPDERDQVCWACEERMARQLDLLGRVTRLLVTVARNEPTGSGELHLPIVDLTLPGAERPIRGPIHDQIGDPPVAAKLAGWWHDWTGRDVWLADAHQISWRLDEQLPWACREYPAIAEFARELRQTYASVRRALSRDMRPVRYTSPCPECGWGMLVRYPGDWIECGQCGRLWDDPDMSQVHRGEFLWARQLVSPTAILDTAQAAIYAGVTVEVIRQWVRRDRLWPIDETRPLRFHPVDLDRCQAVAEHAARERVRAEAERTLRKAVRKAKRDAKILGMKVAAMWVEKVTVATG